MQGIVTLHRMPMVAKKGHQRPGEKQKAALANEKAKAAFQGPLWPSESQKWPY